MIHWCSPHNRFSRLCSEPDTQNQNKAPVSQGVTETGKLLYVVKNKFRQQGVYLGRPEVNRIIAGGRASFHRHRAAINENKITESWLNNHGKIILQSGSASSSRGARGRAAVLGTHPHRVLLQRVLSSLWVGWLLCAAPGPVLGTSLVC